MAGHFADRLLDACRRKGSVACVGIDPRLELLPRALCGRLSPATSYLRFARGVIEAVADLVVAVKPQIAFFEALGPDGMKAYAETIICAREAGLVVIGDAKRADIGSTSAAYAEAHLAPGGGFSADALTVNPYFGTDGVAPFIEEAAASGKGLFVLAKTSNPSSGEIQDLKMKGRPLYEVVCGLIDKWGSGSIGRSGYSSVGAVVGATHKEELGRVRRLLKRSILLVPGYGAQGGKAADLAGAFDAEALGAIVNSSRAVIYAYRDAPRRRNYKDAIRMAAAGMNEELDRVRRGR